MTSVREHYERHLGSVYTWMLGDLDAAIERNVHALDELGLRPGATGVAVDLGAGPGTHAIALARLGFRTIALDDCTVLNDELRGRAGGTVEVVEADLLSFHAHCPRGADAILCMGDTLTHLSSASDVERLLGEVAAALAPGGIFLTTFRDYVTRPLEGEERFILVRADAGRVLTCFLEYGTDIVIVHDLLHERDNATWRLRVSSYPKLRLDPARVTARLEAAGLHVERDTVPGGMVRVVARRL
jgi:SAM-dependent methyltransferase